MFSLASTLVSIILNDRPARKFSLGIIIGLAFSMSVILSTIGLMDGFRVELEKKLRESVGDVFIYSRLGHFDPDNRGPTEALKDLGVTNFSYYLRSEAFVLAKEQNHGVRIFGIDSSFGKVVGLSEAGPKAGNVIVGIELAETLGLKVGDKVVVGLAKGGITARGMPSLIPLKIEKIIKHGVYEKDLRQIYVGRKFLAGLLGTGNKVNLLNLKLSAPDSASVSAREQVENFIEALKYRIDSHFIIRPYWHEFSTLVEAVEVEKRVIGLVLQLIVVISVFNVLAFVLYISTTKARDFFLMKAFGASHGQLSLAWSGTLFIVWLLACALGQVFVMIFQQALSHLPLLKLPGEIYHLGRLTLELGPLQYGMVFGLTLMWLALLTAIYLLRMKRKPILHGLRQEFN